MGKTFKNGGDMKRTLDKLTIVNIPPPTDLSMASAAVATDLNAITPVLARAEVVGHTATGQLC